MKKAYELLMSAPDCQVARCQIAFKAITEGRWTDAAFTLRNAGWPLDNQWAIDAHALADYCEGQTTKGVTQ